MVLFPHLMVETGRPRAVTDVLVVSPCGVGGRGVALARYFAPFLLASLAAARRSALLPFASGVAPSALRFPLVASGW